MIIRNFGEFKKEMFDLYNSVLDFAEKDKSLDSTRVDKIRYALRQYYIDKLKELFDKIENNETFKETFTLIVPINGDFDDVVKRFDIIFNFVDDFLEVLLYNDSDAEYKHCIGLYDYVFERESEYDLKLKESEISYLIDKLESISHIDGTIQHDRILKKLLNFNK